MTLPILTKLKLLNVIVFDDDDRSVTPIFARVASLSSIILTPASLANDNRGKNHVIYNGYHELAYLHPRWFVPDINVLEKLKVKHMQPYFILRFNKFTAHHDRNQKGMSNDQRFFLIDKLRKKGKLFVSCESNNDMIWPELRMNILPHEIHSALYFAHMFVGESQTMSSEAAILGTPSLKCNTFAGKLSIPNELERKFNLCYSYQPEDFDLLINKINELLLLPSLKEEWNKRRNLMLAEKIDVTSFYSSFIENYISSKDIKRNISNY